jgi:hypothetical protein
MVKEYIYPPQPQLQLLLTLAQPQLVLTGS